MSQSCEGDGHGKTCEGIGELGVGARGSCASADGRAIAPSAGGGVAAGLRAEPGADRPSDRPLGAVDVSAAQPLLGRRDRRRRPARVARRAKAPEHDGRTGARRAGAVPGSGAHRWHPRGRPSPGGAGSQAGTNHGPVLGVQPAAPARLAQACPGPAASAKRPAGAAGMEKNSPSGSPKSARSGPGKPRSS